MQSITFNAETAAGLRAQMLEMLAITALGANVHGIGPVTAAGPNPDYVGDTAGSAETSSVETTSTGRGRRNTKPKDKATEVVVTEGAQQNISTGVEREPEAAAPAAEEKQPEPAKELTLDDVRNAAGGYIAKFGMDAAQVDLMPCLKAATGVEKISELAGKDQETLEKAVKAFKAAAASDTRYGQIA